MGKVKRVVEAPEPDEGCQYHRPFCRDCPWPGCILNEVGWRMWAAKPFSRMLIVQHLHGIGDGDEIIAKSLDMSLEDVAKYIEAEDETTRAIIDMYKEQKRREK